MPASKPASDGVGYPCMGYPCLQDDDCDYLARTETELERHIDREHSDEEPDDNYTKEDAEAMADREADRWERNYYGRA